MVGESKQIGPREAAEWLVQHKYRLPAELQPFEREIVTARSQVPAGAAGDANVEPVAQSKQVKLFGRGERPMVKNKYKPPLSSAAYDVVYTLIQAGDAGLTKDKLDTESGHGDARKTMKRLADRDCDWKAVLAFLASPAVDTGFGNVHKSPLLPTFSPTKAHRHLSENTSRHDGSGCCQQFPCPEGIMEKFVDATELCVRLGVTVATIHAWHRRGWIPCLRAGRRPVLFDPNEVECVLRERGKGVDRAK